MFEVLSEKNMGLSALKQRLLQKNKMLVSIGIALDRNFWNIL